MIINKLRNREIREYVCVVKQYRVVRSRVEKFPCLQQTAPGVEQFRRFVGKLYVNAEISVSRDEISYLVGEMMYVDDHLPNAAFVAQTLDNMLKQWLSTDFRQRLGMVKSKRLETRAYSRSEYQRFHGKPAFNSIVSEKRYPP